MNNNSIRVLADSIVALARSRIDISEYSLKIPADRAPHVVDCSSFVKWVLEHSGFCNIPRLSFQQRLFLGTTVQEPAAGDLVFTAARRGYYISDPDDAVGHVGIMTASSTVIHAANKRRGVVEDPWEEFVERNFGVRGMRRIVSCTSTEIIAC